MLKQVGISLTVKITLMLWTIYFDCECMTGGNWPNYPSEQTYSTFRS